MLDLTASVNEYLTEQKYVDTDLSECLFDKVVIHATTYASGIPRPIVARFPVELKQRLFKSFSDLRFKTAGIENYDEKDDNSKIIVFPKAFKKP